MPSRAPSAVWANRIVGYGEIDPAQVLANPRNVRRHTREQKDKFRALARDVGLVDDIMINTRTGFLVDGHLRVEVALEDGQPTLPYKDVDLTPEQENKILAAFDYIGSLAYFDAEAVRALLAETESSNAEMQALLDEILATEGALTRPDVARTDPDEVPEPPAVATTQPGDLWLLGEHRLLCGDCTDEAAVRRLMDGERAVLMATDPPYLVAYDGTNHPQTWHDDGSPRQKVNKQWDSYHEGDEILYTDFLRIALANALTPDVALYQWHADRRRAFVGDAWATNGLLWHQTIIWVKSRPVLTRSHFMWQSEPCAYGWVQGKQQKDFSRRPPPNTPNVWHIDSAASDQDTSDDRVEHPTQKPVETITRPIDYHTRPGELLYEPFSGSGTAIIAAEMTGRRCYAVELEPIYCDVAVARWEAYSGETAERQRASEAA